MFKTIVRHFIPIPLIKIYHYLLAWLAAAWFGHPSEAMIVVGVTGTNGKSTTTQFIGRILEHAGHRVGWTTTASFKVADREWVNDKKMTMLGRFQTQRLLREMVDAGCEYAIVETSSQGIAQSRHIGINYDVAVFTNLTPEHIEAHGGFENYKMAKAKLFERLSALARKKINGEEIEKTIIVNLADPHADFFLSFKADRYAGFAIEEAGENAVRLNTLPVIAKTPAYEAGCTMFSLGDQLMHLKPIGRFNLENALAAIAVAQRFGVSGRALCDAVESLRDVPGRLERIDEGQKFTVIVDYAYEPAALGAVYEAIKLVSHAKIIHVLGSAGGGRDVARREVLGRMAACHDDIVIVTNEDPYDEDPMKIINDVADAAKAAGKQDGVTLFRILDRQEAINQAIALAQSGDLVLVTGKGSEPVMAVAGGKKIPWDDRVAVRKALNRSV
jgi:UDP-N-acetylmuramoyl-L-alanyl-D-glutamate--2,6-diaminopimelate ligase